MQTGPIRVRLSQLVNVMEQSGKGMPIGSGLAVIRSKGRTRRFSTLAGLASAEWAPGALAYGISVAIRFQGGRGHNYVVEYKSSFRGGLFVFTSSSASWVRHGGLLLDHFIRSLDVEPVSWYLTAVGFLFSTVGGGTMGMALQTGSSVGALAGVLSVVSGGILIVRGGFPGAPIQLTEVNRSHRSIGWIDIVSLISAILGSVEPLRTLVSLLVRSK